MTVRLTAAQATIGFLKNQFSETDGKKHAFFGGSLGIFGHGNVAGIGQALNVRGGDRYDERVPGYESWWSAPKQKSPSGMR